MKAWTRQGATDRVDLAVSSDEHPCRLVEHPITPPQCSIVINQGDHAAESMRVDERLHCYIGIERGDTDESDVGILLLRLRDRRGLATASRSPRSPHPQDNRAADEGGQFDDPAGQRPAADIQVGRLGNVILSRPMRTFGSSGAFWVVWGISTVGAVRSGLGVLRCAIGDNATLGGRGVVALGCSRIAGCGHHGEDDSNRRQARHPGSDPVTTHPVGLPTVPVAAASLRSAE